MKQENPGPRIVFYTTAAFSAGHDQRIANISRALHRQDERVRVCVVKPATYGGVTFQTGDDLDLLTTIELPSAFEGMLDPAEVPSGDDELAIGRRRPEFAAERRQALEAGLAGVTADVLVKSAFVIANARCNENSTLPNLALVS